MWLFQIWNVNFHVLCEMWLPKNAEWPLFSSHTVIVLKGAVKIITLPYSPYAQFKSNIGRFLQKK